MKQQIIPATITSINPKVQVTRDELPEPEIENFRKHWYDSLKYAKAKTKYEASRVVMEVENTYPIDEWFKMRKNGIEITPTNAVEIEGIAHFISIGQFCQVVGTREGKCKIVEIN